MKWSKLFSGYKKKSEIETLRAQLAKCQDVIKAKFDAAQTTPENTNHWAQATDWSADREASRNARKKLRERCRYEAANNPWLRGMLDTQARELIGTGARLQMLADDEKLNARIEADFADFCADVNLAEKLRLAIKAKARDGEAFIVFTDRKKPFEISLIDCDRVTSPQILPTETDLDGVIINEQGEVVKYHVSRRHPGGLLSAFGFGDFVEIDAKNVIHLFTAERPEQHRGVPDLTAALPYCAILRRYTLATVKKMETSANISGIISTDNIADDPDDPPEAFAQYQLPRDSFLMLPAGYDARTFEVQSPNESQQNFAALIKCDVGRCLGLPRNLALGDSSAYNYSSGRLDFQEFDRFIKCERAKIEHEVLDRIFSRWLILTGENIGEARHCWYWDGREHVDPNKEAEAVAKRLDSGMTTLAAEYAKEGLDWREQVQQRLDEKQFIQQEMKKRGLENEN